jgi:hypothetical protein
MKFLQLLLMGSLALLLGWSPGHTQFRGVPPRRGGTPDAPRTRADAKPARPPWAGKDLAQAGPNAGTDKRSRRRDREGAGRRQRERRKQPTVPPPWAGLVGNKPKPDRRASILPANVPAWFKEYDTDGDGQVSLSEWKARGHSIEDFKKADLNGDGFITVKELLRAGLFLQQPKNAMNPWQLAWQLRNQVGKFFYFEVTGSKAGNVWGTSIYADASDMATAAVQAGVLRVGQKGFVKVTVLPGQQSYEGSTRNDVTSQSLGAFEGSYRIAKP